MACIASPATGQTSRPVATDPVDVGAAPRPFAHATRVSGDMAVDGKLDEPQWLLAATISDFVQSQPRAGFPATERTVVRVVYDDDTLYIGALCYDSEADKLVITSLEHDFPGGGSTRDMDIFSVTLDTFLDRRNSFIFLVNPGGAFRDGQTFNDSRQSDFVWRAIAEVVTAVHDSGYTVEMAIPWTTLRFNPKDGAQDWGMNLLRRVRRKNEDSYWAPVFARASVQFNTQTDEMVTNIRFNWIYAPVSDVFLVYTERRLVRGGSSGLLARSVTAKVTKLLAF